MQTKIYTYIKHLRTTVTPKKLILLLFVALATGSVYATQYTEATINDQGAVAAAGEPKTTTPTIENIAVVGSDSLPGTLSVSNSWPGEIVSYSTTPVQPERGGTIVQWRVKIGDRVSAGQVLARLSAPPAMPDTVAMLAEKAEGRARMRAQAATTKRFAETNNTQLQALLQSVETTTNQSQATLSGTSSQSGTAGQAVRQAKNAVASMRKNLHTMLDQMLARHGSIVGNVSIAFGSLNRKYGVLDSQNQNIYAERFILLSQALKDPEALPVDAATSYLTSFSRLANTGIVGEDYVDIRDMATEDQEKFFDMLAKYRDAEADIAMKETEYALMVTDKTKEYAEQKKEIAEKMSENEKMTAMAEAEAVAADAAYTTVERSVRGGLAIIAPRSGVVSTISKKIGDFVEPGMPVAAIDAVSTTGRFVRLQIPSNVGGPKAGSVLSVVRPGFTQDVRKIKITGVGTSLDSTGAYMADASFLTPTDWPVASSVRVLVPENSTAPLIKLSAVWWSADGIPHIWGVTEVGRLFARKITIGRTLGGSMEVYQGLKNGDRYVITPTPEMKEDLLLESTARKDSDDVPAKSNGGSSMPGMEM